MDIDIEYHLLVISEKLIDERSAKKSLEVLYAEYRMFVYNVVKKNIFFKLHSEQISKSVVNDVFLAIYNSPLKWSFDPNKHKNQSGSFQAYLSVIALNILRTVLKEMNVQRKKEVLTLDDDSDFFRTNYTVEEFDVIEEVLSKNHQIIEEVLNTFSSRDQDIVKTYFLFFEIGRNIPTEILNEMEQIHKTTRPNIRQIVSRAKKKILELAEERIIKNGSNE